MNQPPTARERFESFVAACTAIAASGAGNGGARGAANEALVLRYFEMWNTGDGSVAEQVLAPTYFDHAHPETIGPAAFRSLVPRFHTRNPKARMAIAIVASNAELVAVSNAVTLVRDGRPETTEGIALFRIEGGKLVEQWSSYPASDDGLAGEGRPPSSRGPLAAIDDWLSFRA